MLRKRRKIRKMTLCMLLALALTALTGCGTQSGIEASKEPFPEIEGVDMDGQPVDNSIFSDYNVTIVNVWSNSCGSCIEEMPELEALYQELRDRGINVIGIGADAGESDEKLAFARKILAEKGVTYKNLAPDPDSAFYKAFLKSLTGYPTTFIVDKEGNIVGNSIVGNVKSQEDTLFKRIDLIINGMEKK